MAALHKINLFKSVSGFSLNMNKTVGVFYNKQNFVAQSALPNICWVANMEILGIHFGDVNWVSEQWKSKLQLCTEEIRFFKTRAPTLDAKAMLSKFKLCSLFSYIGHVFDIPPTYEDKINDMLFRFVVPHRHSSLSVTDFSLPRYMGGYGISNIVLHLNLCLIKPVMFYMCEKVEGKGLSKTSYFTEYQIGRRLCSLFSLPHHSRTPHRFVPNDCYAAILNIIVKYKITVDELEFCMILGRKDNLGKCIIGYTKRFFLLI